MRLLTFVSTDGPRAGTFVSDGTIMSIRDLVPSAPSDMLHVIEQFDGMREDLRAAAARAKGGVAPQSAKLLAPIPLPRRNVFCVGWNYSEHFQEGASFRAAAGAPGEQAIPEYPALFSKNPATVTGPNSAVLFPSPASEQLDWEVELAVIVGRAGHDIKEADAMQHVFGYTCANDVSVRDVQRRHGGQWFKGKNFDTHLPMGPWIVTADELDASALRVQTRVNGVSKQDSNTRFMVFKIPRLISEFSVGCRLEAGDIMITGTPEGVGFARKPPEFMKIGDVVEVEIEGIGVLSNTVAGEVLTMLEEFTWYQQSAFKWKGERLVLYIDPWGLGGDLPPADVILITHAHDDHYSTDDLARIKGPKTVFVAPADVAKELTGNVKSVRPGERIDAAGLKLETVPAYNSHPERLKAHPKKNNWVGYVLRLGDRTYYHAGDTDHNPELEQIRTDVAFLPIGDGGYVMTVDEAAALARAMKPKLAVPMHFGFFPGVGVPSDGERFKKAAAPVDVTVMKPMNPFKNT